jgi:hypothetical protein
VVLRYKGKLDDMDVRCSNSVAVLAVLIGSGAYALFAPVLRAGDRIDFSAPAIPLGVAKPEVEFKAPPGMIGLHRMDEGFAGGAEMSGPSEYYYPVKPKTKGDDTWGLEPLLGDDSDQRQKDDLFGEPSTSNRATNSNKVNLRPELNPNASGNPLRQKNDSSSESDQQNSRFGAQNGLDTDDPNKGRQIGLDPDKQKFSRQIGLDRDDLDSRRQNGMGGDDSKFGTKNPLDRNSAKIGARNGFDKDYSKLSTLYGSNKDAARSGDPSGRGFAGGVGDSFWAKDFGHDASAADRYSVRRWSPSASDGRAFGGSGIEDRMSNPWLGQETTQAPMPPSYPGFASPDAGQSQANDQPLGGSQVSLRAWDPGASTVLPPRNYSGPDQVNNSRFVSHDLPAIIPMPKRPGDPH